MCGKGCNVIQEYEWMNRTCKKSLACPILALCLLGFSVTCSVFGLLGIFKNTSPTQAYDLLFICGLLGSSIVIPTVCVYLLGCGMSQCYSQPKNYMGSLTGAPKSTGAVSPRKSFASH
jgi:hypothetical protein